MIVIMLLLSILAYVGIMLASGGLGKSLFKNNRDRFVFQIMRDLIGLLALVIIWHRLTPHGTTLAYSAAMGLAVLLSTVFSITSYRYGPVGISIMLFSSIAMLISSLSGPVFWGEPISLLQIIGVVLSVLAMWLLTEKCVVGKTSVKWLVFILLAGIGGGMQGPVQKLLATSEYAGENIEFITYTFAFSVVASFLAMFVICDLKRLLPGKVAEKSEENPSEAGENSRDTAEKLTYKLSPKIAAGFAGISALSVFLNINNLNLVSKLPTVIFFSAYSVGGLLITNVAGNILFKEKMTVRQTVGFVTGLIALLLISGTLDGLLHG